jgi:thiamine pyrophosphate-dependent acetolactate synthase large subunit-like protein
MSAEAPTPALGVQLDRPRGHEPGPAAWGSDALAEVVRALGVPFLALNPGASYRGLHDSIVNHLGNEAPGILLCLHEEHAVAIAHAYAKVTGRPLGVVLHSNVGLMHASMALFNAFCDRVPMLALGANGPLAADRRRPWIDWIHTSLDQGALVRPYTKWDDQPMSLPAALDSVVAAHRAASTYPCAPTFVSIDMELQEQPLADPPALPDIARHAAPRPPAPDAGAVDRLAQLLEDSSRTVLLYGRLARGERAWRRRLELADALDARVLTDLKQAAAFPLPHPRHPATPGVLLTASGAELLRDATAIVSLDWVDLPGTLEQAFGRAAAPVPVAHCSLDHVLHRGFSKEHFGLAAVDVPIDAHPDALVERLLERAGDAASGAAGPAARAGDPSAPAPGPGLGVRRVAAALRDALGDAPTCLARVPLSWHGADLRISHPLDFLGHDGGGGIGSGPGMVVGTALALVGSGRLAVGVLGDGDTLMGATALWTAARHRLPLLIVVANNRSFGNDEQHQERVALIRGRPVENRWIGQHIRDPEPDLSRLAGSLGLTAFGPVTEPESLPDVLRAAVARARAGAAVLVDVHVGAEHAAGSTVTPVGKD